MPSDLGVCRGGQCRHQDRAPDHRRHRRPHHPRFLLRTQADFYSYFVGLGLFLLTFVFSALLFHSRPGLYLFAVRDDLDAAETMGVNTRLWKVLDFAWRGFWAGVAGAYYAHFFGRIDPSIGTRRDGEDPSW